MEGGRPGEANGRLDAAKGKSLEGCVTLRRACYVPHQPASGGSSSSMAQQNQP